MLPHKSALLMVTGHCVLLCTFCKLQVLLKTALYNTMGGPIRNLPLLGLSRGMTCHGDTYRKHDTKQPC